MIPLMTLAQVTIHPQKRKIPGMSCVVAVKEPVFLCFMAQDNLVQVVMVQEAPVKSLRCIIGVVVIS